LIPNSTPDGGVWTNYPYGSGTLATITFKTLYRPVEPLPAATCLLNLADTELVGDIPGQDNVTQIPHVATGATYYAQSIPLPRLSIQPSDYRAVLLGEIFNVSVNIEGIDFDWKLVFAQFRVQYNDTLVEAIDVSEGSFMQQFHNTAEPPYTTFINFAEDDPLYGPNVLVGILLIPNSTPDGGVWTDYPYGSGTLATITFKTIYQPSWQQQSLTSELVLNDTQLVEDLNQTSVATILSTLTNGLYNISPLEFSYEPAEPSAGEVTVFKVTEPEDHVPLVFNWNFGDGITVNTTLPTIAHAFPTNGRYDVTLTCTMNNTETASVETVTVESYMPLGVTAEVGTLHFKGETAEFTVLTTDAGNPVDATSLEAKLYFNGVLIADLSTAIEYVDTGFYMIPYYIPATASAGEYTLLVKAEYYGAHGATITKFTISPTLTAWNDSIAQITAIRDGVATISNGVTNLTLNLTTINATLTGLIQSNGEVLARIETTAGALTTKLDTINATIITVQGNTATISSTLGNAKLELDGVQSNVTTTLYATSALSAIAVILAVAILMKMRKK
jgi:PKD repeat protein